MFFANDIILVKESSEGVNGKLELRRKALEAHDFHLTRSEDEV